MEPEIKRGWLKKQGHVVRNWKKRYFVLELGRLSYYTKALDNHPYGADLKGSILLINTIIETTRTSETHNEDNCKIYLIDESTSKDLLLLAPTEEECLLWRNSIIAHMEFAKRDPSKVPLEVDPGRGSEIRSISKAWNAEEALLQRSQNSINDEQSNGNTASGPVMVTPTTLTPAPNFVIKTRYTSGSKVFINVCESSAVPIRGRKGPTLLFGLPRTSVDKTGEKCHVIDVILNSGILAEVSEDRSGAAKEDLCTRIMDAIRDTKQLHPDNNNDIEKIFSLPRLTKKYKGDSVASTYMPGDIANQLRNTSVIIAAASADPVLVSGDGYGENAGGEKRTSIFGLGAKKPSRLASIVASTMPAKPPVTSAIVNTNPKRLIPFIVVRPVGAVVKLKPEKNSPRVKTLLQGAKIYAYGRRTMADQSTWIRLLDGWTSAYSEGGQRMLKVATDSQPIGATVKRLNFTEEIISGWIWDSKVTTTYMIVELNYPRDAIVRVKRSYKELQNLRDLLADSNWKTKITAPFPLLTTSEENPLEPAENVADLLEEAQTWLCNVVKVVDIFSFSPLQTFITPTENDCELMERDLMGQHGLDGAWGEYE